MNKSYFFRLTIIAGVLLAILLTVTLNLHLSTRSVVIPTLMALPTEAAKQVAARPTDRPEVLSVSVETSTLTSASALLVTTPSVQASLTSMTLPSTASITAIPTEPTTETQLATIATETGVIPTAISFPTLPPASASNSAYIPATLPSAQASVPNQVIIAFKPGTSQQAQEAYIASVGGVVKQSIDALDTVVVDIPQEQASTLLPQSATVTQTEPNYYVSALVATPPNDPYYVQQWALPVIGAPDAWLSLSSNAPKVIVAVIDSGICANNPDLQGRVLQGWDYVENDNQPQDAFGHGCAVSGIIAANADDGVGIAGVAPNAMILPLRVLNAHGIGVYSDVAAAIVYATDHGAQVINLSLGGTNTAGVLEQAVNYAISKGVIVVAAAGNTGGAVLYPAAYDSVVSVGSIDENFQPSSFSPTAPVDFLAPGRNILSLKLDNTYATMSGTSFAAPQVAGIAALEIASSGILSATNGIIHFGGDSSIPSTPEPTSSPEAGAPIGGQINAGEIPTRETQAAINLTSDLTALASAWGENQTQALALGQARGLEISGSQVAVTVTTTDAAAANAAKAQVTALGGQITSEYDRWFDAQVPVPALTTIASLIGVNLVQPIVRVYPADDVTPEASPSNDGIRALAGSALSQGVAASNANNWQAGGINGTGVTVAVIDCGFLNYGPLQSQGELPPSPRLTTMGAINTTCDHGAAVAEIVTDMAPGISMILVSPTSGTEMASDITALANLPTAQRPKVITSSVGYYNLESGAGSGPVSDAIAYALSKGVLFTQAAGNQAFYNWQNTFSDANANGWLDFAPNVDINQFGYLPKDVPLQLYLRWNNWPTTNQDYNFYVVRYNSTTDDWDLVAGSTSNQASSAQPPVEGIYYVTDQEGYYGLAVFKYSATGNQVIDIMGHNVPDFQFGMPERSLIDPATSTSVFSVAALDTTSPYPREYYSSEGPSLGSGGSLGTGNSQPRIASFANVDTATFGADGFNGTSSATPHVAGAAALVWQANPSYTVAQVKSFLESHSVDMGAAGYDALYGTGRLYLGTVPTVAPSITNQPVSTEINSGQTATLSVVAAGSPTLSYQWYRGTAPSTTNPVGTNSASFTTPALSVTTSYWVRVTNSLGHADSSTATVAILPSCLVFPYTATTTTELLNAVNCANTMHTDDVINLTPNGTYTLTTTGFGVAGASSSGTLTINGNGATITRSSAGGTPNFRLVEVVIGGNLTLNNLTLNNGYAFNDYGGTIRNKGTLTINNSVISNSQAPEAGAIYNTEGGTLTVNNSTFSHNTSGNTGGAIHNDYNSTLIVNNSTFDHNAGDDGGGIFNNGLLTVTNSTFIGNTATTDGGGIRSDSGTTTISNSTFNGNTANSHGGGFANWVGASTVTNSTFYGNSATTQNGGGIFNNPPTGGSLKLGNSLLALNTASQGPNIGGTVNSLGYNLIANSSGATITGTTTGNLLDAAASPLNLLSLENNGGPTLTMALGAGSVAINAGDPNVVLPPTYDQRGTGFPRVIGGRIDIGAYEASCPTFPYTVPVNDARMLIFAISCANSNGPGTNDVINLTYQPNTGYSLNVVNNTSAIGDNGLPQIMSAATAGTLTINGNGALVSRYPIGGTPSFRLLYMNSGANLTLNNIILANGLTPNNGGAIANFGTLTINSGMIQTNSANAGGAIFNSSGTLTLNKTTLKNNQASTNGAGLFNDVGSSIILINSAIGNNIATAGGGAIYNLGTLTSNDSTLFGNTSPQASLQNSSGTVTLNNTIVAFTGSGADCSTSGGTFTASYSLIKDGSCGVSSGTNGNLIGDPMIGTPSAPGPSAPYFPTYWGLMNTSPAINAGNNALIPAGVTTDEAGGARISNSTVDMGAYEVQSICPTFPHTVPSGNVADLITSITCANSNGVGTNDVINLTGSTYTLTTVNNTSDGPSGLPVIASAATSGTLTINGNGATITRNSAGGTPNFRILEIATDANLTLNNMTLTNGNLDAIGGHGGGAINNLGVVALDHLIVMDNAAPWGGGIYNTQTLSVTNSTVSNNTADQGAGIYNDGAVTISDTMISYNETTAEGAGLINTGTMTVLRSTIYANSGSSGSGILNVTTMLPDHSIVGGILKVINSTIASNTANGSGIYGGGAIESRTSDAQVLIINSTIADNTATQSARSGIWAEGTVTLQNSIVANNNGANNCAVHNSGTIIDGGHNLDNGSSCGFGGTTGQNTNPLLGSLTSNGGSTVTFVLQAGSPAINAGDNSKAVDQNGAPLPTDQRSGNFARIINTTVDIGAFEVQTTCPTFPYTVSPGNVSDLIFAIACANSNGNGTNDVINLTNSTYTLTTVNNSADGDNGLPVIPYAAAVGTLTINGNGATITRSSIGGTPNFRILQVAVDGNLTLDKVIISNGSSATNAAGLYNNRGTLTLNNSTVSGNMGAGVNTYLGTTTITNSTISGNAGSGVGSWASTVTVTNSTIAGNTTSGFGGGLSIGFTIINGTYYPSVVTVLNSTITGNTAQYGGGVYTQSGLTLGNSIVAGNNGTTKDIDPTVNSLGYNIIGSTAGLTITGTTTGNLLDAAAAPLNLGALANNGGITPTMALGTGSVALNAGNPSFAPPPDYDQRGAGFPRVVGGRIDIGAYESPFAAASITTSPQSQSILTGQTATLSVVATGTAPLTYQWYQGTAPSTTTPVGTNSASFTTPALTITTSYWVRVSNSYGGANSSTAIITVVAPPANDLIANATIISTLPTTLTQDPFGSTVSGTDPTSCASSVNTVWFKFTASSSQAITVTTQGSNYDTVLAAYTGTLGSLTSVGCDNDSGKQTRSWLGLNVTSGTPYYLMVAKLGSSPLAASATLTLNISAVPTGDTLALYNSSTGSTSLIDTLQDTPPASAYTTYLSNAPVLSSAWIMGDWDGDGQKTPGLWSNGAFFFTNTLGTPATWQYIWIGPPTGALVAGRFDPARSNECIGIVIPGYAIGFPLVWTCDFSTVTPTLINHWIGLPLEVTTGSYQFTAGDWNNDGIDTIGVRRGVYAVWSNAPMNQSLAVWLNGQYLGDPQPGQYGQIVAGDWNSDHIDSFGLYYAADGTFFRRNDLDWNSGIYILQHVGLPVGSALAASFRAYQGATFSLVPRAFGTPQFLSPEATNSLDATEMVIPEETDTLELPTVEVTDMVAPIDTATPEVTEIGDAPTVSPTDLATDLPAALPFPTLPPPASPTSLPTALPFPTLLLPASPTDLPTTTPLTLPALASFDDGASDWSHSNGWQLAVYDGGLAWLMSSSTSETLRWQQSIDLRGVQGNVALTFQSHFVGDGLATVQISTDAGVTWLPISVVPASESWTTVSVDLSGYSVIELEFVWQETNAETTDTWGLDTVVIDRMTPTLIAPEETATATATATEMPTSIAPEATDERLLPTSDASS